MFTYDWKNDDDNKNNYFGFSKHLLKFCNVQAIPGRHYNIMMKNKGICCKADCGLERCLCIFWGGKPKWTCLPSDSKANVCVLRKVGGCYRLCVCLQFISYVEELLFRESPLSHTLFLSRWVIHSTLEDEPGHASAPSTLLLFGDLFPKFHQAHAWPGGPVTEWVPLWFFVSIKLKFKSPHVWHGAILSMGSELPGEGSSYTRGPVRG